MKTYNYNHNGSEVCVRYDDRTFTIFTKGREVTLPRMMASNHVRHLESGNPSMISKAENWIFNLWTAGTTRVG